MNFNKKAFTIDQQIAFLKGKNLSIDDEKKAKHYLSNVSYYRLKAYFLSFRRYNDPNRTYVDWANFSRVADLYVFDRELRFILLNAIERIEVAVRCRISYEFSILHGNNWYEDKSLYNKNFIDNTTNSGFDGLQKKIKDELSRTKEEFIRHYKQNYTSPKNPPSWMLIEVLSFGQLSIMYKNLQAREAKKAVAQHFGLSYTILESWLEHIAYVRNICAHHSRLWNRHFIITPTIPKITEYNWVDTNTLKPDRVYVTICIMAYLLDRVMPQSYFAGQIKALIRKHSRVDINAAGFPAKWKQDTFWRSQHIPITFRARFVYFRCRNFIFFPVNTI